MWTTLTTRLLKVEVGIRSQHLDGNRKDIETDEAWKRHNMLRFISWRIDHIESDSKPVIRILTQSVMIKSANAMGNFEEKSALIGRLSERDNCIIVQRN